ncbi:MAG: T9SS type A sorting domain-containing protein, partial [Paludibacteraceae bacterium]|nr:T9SS type A sorting domain-containing protein [Paludibacteraceae bacterium]
TSAVTGCDSITTLYLTMCDNVTYNYHGAFCAGGSYSDEFFENITAPGQYSTTAISEIGCETYANLTLHMLAQNQAYEDSVDIRDLPYVLGNDTLCPETDQAGFVYHGQKDFGCGMVSVTIKVYDKTALTNVSAASLQVAPNPVLVGEDIRILTDIDVLSDYSCRVFDAVGKLVYESFEPSKTIPGLPTAGMYTVRIASGSTIYQGKLIVK